MLPAKNKEGGNSVQAVLRYVDQLRGLSEIQKELFDLREQVLIQRESVLESEKVIRKQRERCAIGEVELMDRFRKHHNRLDSSTPNDLDEAYNNVERERNTLVRLEEAHSEVVLELGLLEWKLADAESDLYQYNLPQILSEYDQGSWDAVAASEHEIRDQATEIHKTPVDQDYRQAMAENKRLIVSLDHLRNIYASTLGDLIGSETQLPYHNSDAHDIREEFGDLLADITQRQVAIQHMKAQRYHVETMERTTLPTYPSSENLGRISLNSPGTTSQTRSTTSLPSFVPKVADPFLVQGWLLDRLRQSSVERTYYMGYLRSELKVPGDSEFSFQDWERLVIWYWFFKPSRPTVHKGDVHLLPANEASVIPSEAGLLETKSVSEGLFVDPNTTLRGVGQDFDTCTHATSGPSQTAEKDNGAQCQTPVVMSGDKSNYTSSPQSPSRSLSPPADFQRGITPSLKITLVETPPDLVDEAGLALDRLRGASSEANRHDSAQNSDQGSDCRNLSAVDEHDMIRKVNDERTKPLSMSQGSHSDEDGTSPVEDKQDSPRPVAIDSSVPSTERDTQPQIINREQQFLSVVDKELSGQIYGVEQESDFRPRLPALSLAAATGPQHDMRNRGYAMRHQPRLEQVHSYFRVIPQLHCRKFFSLGQVFEMVWCEQENGSSHGPSPSSSRDSSSTGLNHYMYHERRSFIAIKSEGNICLCAPIESVDSRIAQYSPYSCSLIYTGDHAPSISPAVFHNKRAIRVLLDDKDDESLPPGSYIQYKIPLHVEHSTNVRSIGRVDSLHRPELLGNLMEYLQELDE